MKNRGMLLESVINRTNSLYKRSGIALIHKKKVDIKFSSVTKGEKGLKVNNAFIEKKSFSDYYGIYKGRYIAFEAKSTKLDALPLSNIKTHQHKYLKDVSKYGGISFYIFYFKKQNKFFYIDWKVIETFKKKSFHIDDAFNYGQELDIVFPGIIDYVFFCK